MYLAKQHCVEKELEGGGEEELLRRVCEHEVDGLEDVAGAPAVEEEGAGLGLRRESRVQGRRMGRVQGRVGCRVAGNLKPATLLRWWF